MYGSNNNMTVAFGKNVRIELVGADNAITWTTPDGKEPAVSNLGAGNTLIVGK
jgi:hypothetical protein